LQSAAGTLLASKLGKANCFSETDVRSMGRTATGVRGMRLGEGQKIISMITSSEGTVLNVTENGYGKRTKLEEFLMRV
jgi:DNA gyrase subunit A